MNAKQVRDIVQEELVKLKRQIDAEFMKDLAELKYELVGMINEMKDAEVIQPMNKSTQDNIECMRENTDNQIVSIREETKQQLAQLRESTKELIVKFGAEVQKNTYNKVIDNINKTIVPRMDNLIEYVNYHNQDGQEIITNYRRAVDDRVNGQKMLTDGVDDGRIISENVSMFFGEEKY